MINVEKAVHSDWFHNYNWNDDTKCYLKRKAYGDYLSSYIRNQKKGLVLNLNGEWGTGKTFFLKQLYTDLLKEHKIPTVYINAWKSDFSNDPLLVIISELLDQMSELFLSEDDGKQLENQSKTNEILSKLGVLSKKVYNGGLDVVAAYLSTKNEDWNTGLDATALTAIASHLKVNADNKLEVDEPRLGKSLKDDYKKQIKAIEDTKSLMSAYANLICRSDHMENQGKIYVLVDELDRCRPPYAIELLETIKHLFDIPNFVFVVATDTAQLSHSIKAVYGDDFNGQEYLSRFFNRTATIPQGNLRGLVKALVKDTYIVESFSKGIMLPNKGSEAYPLESDEDFIAQEITNIAILYDIKPRKIAQLIAKFESIVVEAYQNPRVIFDFRMLLQLLAEYSIDGFYECYLYRKYAQGNEFLAAHETKKKFGWERYDTGLVGHLLREKSFSKELPVATFTESQQSAYLKEKYNSSWMFFSRCVGSEIDFQSICSLFKSSKVNTGNHDQMASFKSKIHNNYAGLTEKIYSSLTTESEPYYVWTKDTYFKKVEIADSLS
ncbi:KAP family NTPase [Photobacterium chitinilyticum]|uniref:KAP family P-loop NTPase fold protein n=1 Tax=Photobacterium chitinilyticum TaxID=2485123 RepID=UPI003D149C94